MSRSHLFAAALTAFLLAAGTAAASSVIVTVDGTAGPWSQATNPSFSYGVGDNNAPTVVLGLPAAGQTITITYLSGLTSAFGGVPPTVDGNGYVGSIFKNDVLGSSGQPFPSFYMSFPPDIFLNALVGTFTDASGKIVGTPFAAFDGPTDEIVPVGATQLQLGVNDDIFGDNSGALSVEVDGLVAPVAEPFGVALLGLALAGTAGFFRRKH